MSKKRYIVTFQQPDISEADVAGIMNKPRGRVRDGMSLLASEVVPEEKEILHLKNWGMAVASMDDQSVPDLKAAAGVLAVEEDVTYYAIGDCSCAPSSAEFSAAESRAEPSFERRCGPDEFTICVPRRFPWPHFPPGGLPERSKAPLQVPSPEYRWNMRMIGADLVHGRVTGRGVKVAVLDTGIDLDHPDLTVKGGVSFIQGHKSFDDDHGHGTHCAGIIGARANFEGVIGVAPECDLFAVKVLDAQGSGPLSGILSGLCWAANNGMDVVSLSLGRPAEADEPCSAAYERAAQRLNDQGCLVVAAAGNEYQTSRPSVILPARCAGFMAVGAVDAQENVASFSSRGPADLPFGGVEIAAPGVRIFSTYVPQTYRTASGTSMACPHVAGAAALLKEQRPTWTAKDIRKRLKGTARDIGLPGNDIATGTGLLDVKSAVFG